MFRLEKENLTDECTTTNIEKTKPSSAPEDEDMFSDDGGLVEAMLHVPR